jgi:hypothetical protein
MRRCSSSNGTSRSLFASILTSRACKYTHGCAQLALLDKTPLVVALDGVWHVP